MNDLSHRPLHIGATSLVWMSKYELRVLVWLNDFLYSMQLCGFSPLWWTMCFFRLPASLNDFHTGHKGECVNELCWTFFCSLCICVAFAHCERSLIMCVFRFAAQLNNLQIPSGYATSPIFLYQNEFTKVIKYFLLIE